MANTNNNSFENIVTDFRNCYRKLERITNENEPVSKREWECARALYIYARYFVETYEEAIENDNINIKDELMKKYRNALNNIRKEIVAELIAIMKKYNCDEVDTYELDSTPIVIDGATYDEGYTLDSIILMDGTKPYLVFCCSSTYDDDRIDSNNVSIDNLADILEWVKENENDMF